MSFFLKIQINKIKKMKQCNMEDISAVSSLASKLGMKSLLTFLYNNPDEYLAYIKDNK